MVKSHNLMRTYTSPEVELVMLDKELCAANGSSNSNLSSMDINGLLDEEF